MYLTDAPFHIVGDYILFVIGLYVFELFLADLQNNDFVKTNESKCCS